MAIVVIFVFFCLTLTTSAPLQGNTLLNSDSDFSSNSAFQIVYAAEDAGGGDAGGGDAGGGDDEGSEESGDEGSEESGDEGSEESGDEGSEESGDEGSEESGDGNDESEASDTTSSSSTGDASSFFGGGEGSNEGTPESASADASESTDGTTGSSPPDSTFYNRYATTGASPTEGGLASLLSESSSEGTPTPEQSDGTGANGAASIGSSTEEDASSFFGSKSTSTPGLAEGKSSGAQGLYGTPGSTDTSPIGGAIGDAAKDTADVIGKATTPATTGGGDQLEAAKNKVAALEAQLQAVKQKSDSDPFEVLKEAYKQETVQLQAQLEAAKQEAYKQEAYKQEPVQLQAQQEATKQEAAKQEAAKDSDTKKSPTTTPATTTGGGGGKATTPATTTGGGAQLPDKDKIKEVVKVINKNKVVVRDSGNDEKEIIIAGDKITCPTQTETVSLNAQINPKGIRLLADFDTCRISDGSVTLNMPNTDNIKLALLFIDKIGSNDAGVLVKPVKIQDLSTNQALFTRDLDGNMNGINPITGQSTSISKINGLALYNDGNEPIQFNSGNMAALTATFTK